MHCQRDCSLSKKKPNPVGRRIRPKNKKQLQEYLATYFNLEVPAIAICEEHQSPLDYAWYAFSADYKKPTPLNADCIVWANRGGGKTKLAAALTLLDCIFKPNCQCRILSGSGDQAGRMFDYFIEFIAGGFEDLTCGRITKTICCFKNKSQVEVLKQSETSVRSHHVHKVRCDEVELFSQKVFDAAKFTTQSTVEIVGAFEVISTMNTSSGIMRKIIRQAEKIKEEILKQKASPRNPESLMSVIVPTPLLTWCLWDVIEKCVDRNCKTCPLFPDCQGKAKKGTGFYKINDAISQQQRSPRRNWVYEMLCNPDTKSGKSYMQVKERRY